MTADGRAAILNNVGAATRRLTLEIDPSSDPITGRLGDGSGARPFSGWLELAAALHALLDPDEPTVVHEHRPSDA